MPTSANVANYHIGKGIVSFKETGTSTFIDLGNAPSFLYTPKIDKLEHFSSRTGVKTKDFTAVTTVGASVKFTLDEITGNNLSLFALATIDATTPGQIVLSGLKKTVFRRYQGGRHQRDRPERRLHCHGLVRPVGRLQLYY
jgi:hypothetical protein